MCICILAAWLAFTPALVLQVRTAEDDRLLLCSPVAAGDQILYLSVNSIFQVPVQEYWRVEPDGSLTTMRVVSTPAVMGYYGIEDYAPGQDGFVSAAPQEAHYQEIRLKEAVMGYYGIEDYAPAQDGFVSAAPQEAHYQEIRLKVDSRGQERLVVRGQETALYKMTKEAGVVIASVHRMPRIAACHI
ncbi:MAG: hypothetical protein M1132_03835 [Chloroflexi bacterium]|nr:hypothetical protein [Chloroflexota bacterium]